MHQSHKVFSIVLLAALVLGTFSAALAAPAAQGLLPCSADPVTGTVVVVDETNGLVTVDPPGAGEFCTVDISTDVTHPIALLLGYYFGDDDFAANQEAQQEALTNAQTCATTDGTNWTWVACGTEGALDIRVTGFDQVTGSYTAVVVDADGTLGDPVPSILITDPPTVERLNGALTALAVDWELEDDGSLMLVSDKVMELHEQGMGFGVLVKLFALSEASNGLYTVDFLKGEFESGKGMGTLFKEYGGKPDLRGVGHVRQDLKDGDEVIDDGEDTELDNGQGNGNQPPGQEKKDNKPLKDKVKDKDNKLKGTSHAVPKAKEKGGKP